MIKDKEIEELTLKAHEIAEKCGVKVWKVYYVGSKLNLDRLPTVEEVINYRGQVGRPFKGAKNVHNNHEGK